MKYKKREKSSICTRDLTEQAKSSLTKKKETSPECINGIKYLRTFER